MLGDNYERGFLPREDPLKQLPMKFSLWEECARNLPKYMLSNNFQNIVQKLPDFPVQSLNTIQEYERAMCILSFIGHAWIWRVSETNKLIQKIAMPWYEIGTFLGRPPVLSYASYALNNWYRIDPEGPIALGNIALIQNFLGGVDEEWFVLIHIDIEQKAALAISNLVAAQSAAASNDWARLVLSMHRINESIKAMVQVLERMPEHCDPYIYFHRVRPYIHGWKNNPALPDGLIYEGVDQYGGQPQKFCGETGAQSSIIPALDAALGITHKEDPLRRYLIEMREYMPPLHSQFISQIESKPSVTELVQNTDCPPDCFDLLKKAIQSVAEFRNIHLRYAKSYIVNQNEKSKANPTGVGTGGTPFVPYLSKHLQETLAATKT